MSGLAVLGAGLPDEQAADGVLAVQRLQQAADLVAVPDVAALELGQGHAAQVDLVQDRADLYDGPSYHKPLFLHPSAITLVRRPRASATARGSESRPCTTRTASSWGRHSANFSPSSAASLTVGPSPRRSLPARSRSPRSMMSGGWARAGRAARRSCRRSTSDVQPPSRRLVGQGGVGPTASERPPGGLVTGDEQDVGFVAGQPGILHPDRLHPPCGLPWRARGRLVVAEYPPDGVAVVDDVAPIRWKFPKLP